MIGGILIGIGISTFIFLLAWLLRGGSKPSPITYLLLGLVLIVMSIEGILMMRAIDAKNNLAQKLSLVQETITSYLPQKGQDYTLTAEQASALRLALGFALPLSVKDISAEDLEGKTVIETTNMIRKSVERGVTSKVRKAIWVLVISAIAFTILLYLAYAIPIGGVQYGKKSNKAYRPSSTSRSDDF